MRTTTETPTKVAAVSRINRRRGSDSWTIRADGNPSASGSGTRCTGSGSMRCVAIRMGNAPSGGLAGGRKFWRPDRFGGGRALIAPTRSPMLVWGSAAASPNSPGDVPGGELSQVAFLAHVEAMLAPCQRATHRSHSLWRWGCAVIVVRLVGLGFELVGPPEIATDRQEQDQARGDEHHEERVEQRRAREHEREHGEAGTAP